MRKITDYIRICGVAALVSTPVWADDSDIYLNTSDATVGIPKVMLVVDLRSNTGGSPCNPLPIGENSGCYDVMGELLYPELDLYRADGSRGSDGHADLVQPADGWNALYDPNDVWIPGAGYGYLTVAEKYWPDGNEVVLADFVRTTLRVVLQKVHQKINDDPKVTGVEVGIMVGHEDNNNCGSGPDKIPGPGEAGCSQGAYVLQGFVDIADKNNLDTVLTKLAAIPHPGATPPWANGGWNGHAYVIRDIYFEFYRYITGKDVYNGFLDFEDYKTTNTTSNLYVIDATVNDVQVPIPYDPDDATAPLLSMDLSTLTAASLPLPDDTTSSRGKVSDAEYLSPLEEADECSAFYMIHTFFGDTNPASADTSDAIEDDPGTGSDAGLGLKLKAQDAGDITLVAAMHDTDFGRPLFMTPGDLSDAGDPNIPGVQNVTSYFLAKESKLGGAKNYIHEMAAQGGSQRAYPLDDPKEAIEALSGIFDAILSVSTTFVSASVPVNVYNRSETLDNIYFALFKAEKGPRWSGNVKKLKVLDDPLDPSVRRIYDADGELGIAADGRIERDALTFWTDPAGWDVAVVDPNELEVPFKDGRSITRGGAGQKVAGFLTHGIAVSNTTDGARQMYTEDPGANLPQAFAGLFPLDQDTADLDDLRPYLDPNDALGDGVAGDEERKLIGWVRGMDAFDQDDPLLSRSWIMGDSIHSRPLVINYGNATDPNDPETSDIRLYFGTNAGVFHQIKNTDGNIAEFGGETFSFVPLELMSMQNELRENLPRAIEPHPYGMDGEPVSFVKDVDRDGDIKVADGDSVQVFVGMRRGGNGYYAFDVSNPDAPGLDWKIWGGDATNYPDFTQLAMTFSTPVATELDLGGASLTPVLIFAGGYNGGWNGANRVGKDDLANNADDEVGNAIYVVNAETGALIWKAVGPDGGAAPTDSNSVHYAADMVDTIPSAISVVDSDLNAVPDRAYVADTGGILWRVELTEASAFAANTDRTTNWYVTKLADLTNDGSNAAARDRRFFHAPDYVRTKDDNGFYDGILITSGDRAHPTETGVENWAYLIKDRNVTTNPLGAMDPNHVVLTDSVLPNITDCQFLDPNDPCGDSSVPDLASGWKLELEETGEKGLSKPLVTNGIAFFTSYLPLGGTPGKCAPGEGSGRLYAVNLSDGTPAFELSDDINSDWTADRFIDIGEGIPPDVKPYEGDSILAPGKGIDGKQIFNVPGVTKWRIYWREEDVDRL